MGQTILVEKSREIRTSKNFCAYKRIFYFIKKLIL